MIISASRRTDIPAFYAEWFINRTRQGHCLVPNPFNWKQVARVSLEPEDVDAIVFWTRDPRPLFRHLDELTARGYCYYFQYTVVDHARELEPGGPPLATALRTFRELAEQIGPERVVWRYDPIVLTPVTDAAFHEEKFGDIACALRGRTHRCVVSIADLYPKVRKRLQALSKSGLQPIAGEAPGFDRLMRAVVRTAGRNDMEIVSCAEATDLRRFGIEPGRCIDNRLLRRIFGIKVIGRKDPSQRKRCRCVLSRDIGMYDTCPTGCTYCYATNDPRKARANYSSHDPDCPSLMPLP
jgi:hypothetical protein